MLSSLHSWVSANASTNPISKSVVVRTQLTVLWWGCRTKSTRNHGPPWFRGRWDLNRIWRFVTRGGDNLAVGSRTCPTRGRRYSSVVTGTMGWVTTVRRGEVTDRDNWQSGSSWVVMWETSRLGRTVVVVVLPRVKTVGVTPPVQNQLTQGY